MDIKKVGIANCLKDFVGNEYVIKNTINAANPQINCFWKLLCASALLNVALNIAANPKQKRIITGNNNPKSNLSFM